MTDTVPLPDEFKDKQHRKRTVAQNAALHKGFDLLAEQLNDAGLDQRKVLKPSVNIPWTPEAVKNQLYRPIMDAMYDIQSTTELDTKQVSEVYDVLTRHLAEKFGIDIVSFPSIEELIWEQQTKEEAEKKQKNARE